MKFKQLLEGILLEATAKEILMAKAGLNEYNADLLSNTFGKLAVKIFKKILDGAVKLNTERPDIYQMSGVANYRGDTLRDKIIEYFNDRRSAIQDYFGGRTEMNSLRDYIRIGLNNNYDQIENLTIPEMIEKSEEWHKSMGVGDSQINYTENKPIILDFRDDGVGFYWVDLQESDCTEEKERMGHCGSSAGNLYSLRSFKKIEAGYTLNKSHLTASIDSKGRLLQLKGPKNTKPGQEYHRYILPLLYFKIDENKYLINSIGYEYNSEYDFKISDLEENLIKKLYEDRPELFTGRQERKTLKRLKLTDVGMGSFTFHISAKNAEDYVAGELKHIVKDILYGDTYQYWDNYEYADWKSAIQYDIDQENSNKIVDMLRNSKGFDETLSLEGMIEEFDETEEIRGALRSAINDAESQDYENYLYNELRKVFGEYGDVVSMDDRGVEINVDLDDLIQTHNVYDEFIDEISEDRCDGEIKCIFEELISDGYIEKPRFNVNDHWYPNINRQNFNEILNDRLNEI